MSSKQIPNCRDPVHGKMPRLHRSVGDPVHPGFSSSQHLPRYTHEEPTNYNGTYLSLCLSGEERRDISAPWNSSRTCLQTGRSPVLYPTSVDRVLPNHLLHRLEHTSCPEEKSPNLEPKELTAEQKVPFYENISEKLSPGVLGVHTPIVARKVNVDVATISPHTESSVGVAIPKPVYGHNVCCSELGCSSAPSYSTEHGATRMHQSFCDKEWMLQYGPLSFLQRKERDALMQRKVLELEHSRRLFKEGRLDGYLALRPPGSARMPFTEQNYSNFQYSGPASMLGPSGQPYHSLRLPSKMHHGLSPSPSCTYEVLQPKALSHSVSSSLYSNHTPGSPGHTQCPPHLAFYYPQEGTEVPNNSAYSDLGGSPRQDSSATINKQNAQNPPGQYQGPHSIYTDIPAPCPITPQGHSFLRSYEVLPYQLYKMHSNASQKRTFSDGPGSTPFKPRLEDYSSLKSQLPSPSRALCGQGFGSSAFHPVQPRYDHGSLSQESVTTCSVLNGGLASPKEAVPQGIISYHQCETGITDLSSSNSDSCSSLSARALTNKESVDPNSVSTALPAIGFQEDSNLFEIPKKPEEREQKQVDRPQHPSSPPMPIINNVFSLAPYKAYLEAAGILPATNVPESGELNSDVTRLIPGIQINEEDAQSDSKPKDKSISPGGSWPSQEEVVNIREPKKIKPEPNEDVTGDSFKTDQTRNQEEHSALQEMDVDKEETNALINSSSPEDVLDLSVKNCDTHESCKVHILTGDSEFMVPSSEGHGTAGPCVVTSANNNPFLVQISSKPSPPQGPSDTKFWIQHIPPAYHKLSTFKIVLPKVPMVPSNNASEVPFDPKVLEGTTAHNEPPVEPNPCLDISKRARHRFMELHQSLCRLISSCVSCTPEQELRAWFDDKDQKLSSSHTKSQRVSSLLGVEVRDVWLKCNDTAALFQQVIGQLESFVSSCKCPFPHVVRAGMLFIPMLVMKESLFPQVPGAFIDQVLQERRVELRPTTLSEERHLAQLQKRSCSSKLRRLLSLKHLPDVYPDVLNLFYYACVSKRLDATSRAGAQQTAQGHSYFAECPEA